MKSYGAARRLAWAVAVVAGTGCHAGSDESGVTLRVMNWAADLEIEMEQRIADRFAASRPGVQVIVESIVTNYGEKLITSIAAGTPPDVFLLDVSDIPAFVDRGLVLDLAPYAARVGYDPDAVFPQVLDVFANGDRLFAFPKGFTPMVVYYNRRLFAERAIAEPDQRGWTWEEFLAVARRLTRDVDGDGRTDVYGINFPRQLYEWIPWVWSAGADIMDPDGRRTVGYLDSEETVEAFEFLTSLVTEWEVVPPFQYQRDADPMTVGRFFVGLQAMQASGHWQLPRLRAYAAEGDLDLGIAPIPHRAGATPQTVIYASGWAVPTNVRFKRLAVELAAFLGGPEAQRMRAQSGIEISANRHIAEELAAQDTSGLERAFLQEVIHARVPWGARVMDFHEIELLALDIMDRRILQGDSLAVAAAEVARRIDEVIAR